MKKILLLLVLLGGCDDENIINDSQPISQTYWRTCIDGKQFISSLDQLSINLDFNGKPIPCEEQTDE
jgi:hypothetical protein